MVLAVWYALMRTQIKYLFTSQTPARNLLQRSCAGDICVDFCAAVNFNPVSAVVSALIAWSFGCVAMNTL